MPALAEIAHRHGLKLIIDNTFLSPALYRPLEDGADLVIHSATKYLAGHGEVLGGVVSGSEKRPRRFAPRCCAWGARSVRWPPG